MEPGERSRAYHVQAGAQAAALEHFLRAWLLMACTRRARSLSDLAREMGLPLRKAHYHVTRLADCGLLRVDRTAPRRGRPIKYYRAVAEEFLVDSADISEQVSDRFSRELRQSVAEQVNRRESHLRYYLDESERLRVKLVDTEGRALTERALDYWMLMRLTAEKRMALAAELTALIARYQDASSNEDGELFLVHAAFAPARLRD